MTDSANSPTQTDQPVAKTNSVDKSGARIQRMFGEISPKYDLLNHLLSGGIDYIWRRKTVRTIPPRGNAPILDVCTGTGDLAIAYWRKSRQSVRVIGTDFTHEMVCRANAKAAKLKRHNDAAAISFLDADTLKLPFPDDSFQIVSVAFGLRNVSETVAGLTEMTRVCQPGGTVVVLEFSMPKNRLIGKLYRWYFRNVLPKIGQWISGSRQAAYEYLPASVSEFPQDEKLAQLMQQSGLQDIQWKSLTFGVATLYYGRKPDSHIQTLRRT
ncbi:MAG: bifunctional demethylmenaquinone methyltransferase/2-methoxy-6-polyprenyl-1,4-benzoquinol methylase UbiE [Planctomycetaceae bacterium]